MRRFSWVWRSLLLGALFAGPAFGQEPTFLRQWGSHGTGPGQFQAPFGIAIDAAGSVYVCDQYNCRIQVFTADGTFVRMWGTAGKGPGQFTNPHSIGIDAVGRVVVVDFDDRVQVFTSNGAFIRQWVHPWTYPTARDLTVAPDGTVYIANPEGLRIEKFTQNGTFLGGFGVDEGVGSVTLDPFGNVYAGVVRQPVFEILKFTAAGALQARWGSIGTGDGQFNSPVGIAASSSVVYVADYNNVRVQYFSPDGAFLGKWGTYGTGPGQFQQPVRVAVSPRDEVYVVDAVGDRIEVFADVPTATTRASWGALKQRYR